METHPLWRAYREPTDEQIQAAMVTGRRVEPIEVMPPDPGWPAAYDVVRRRVEAALGEQARDVRHVGSTAVPGLHAKPVVDVDVTVADTAAEGDYLAALEDAGFELTVREPGHRCLRLAGPRANLHLWDPGDPEPRRHLAFRDWLTEHTDDRAAYGDLKCALAAEGFTDVMSYNNRKAALIYDIYERIFAADPDHAHTPRPRPRT